MESFNKLVVLILVLGVTYCGNLHAQTSESETNGSTWIVFGESFDTTAPVQKEEIMKSFETLENGKVTEMSIKGRVKSVCQVKGCWMVIDLDGEEEARVTFKDYGFFVPVDLIGKEVLVNGMASSKLIGVEELRHYAEDAGLSKEEIDKINNPEKAYSLVANGVMLRE